MSADVIRFPPRQSVVIHVMPADGAWLVQAGAHGWIHGDVESARCDAQWLSQNLSIPVREAKGA